MIWRCKLEDAEWEGVPEELGRIVELDAELLEATNIGRALPLCPLHELNCHFWLRLEARSLDR